MSSDAPSFVPGWIRQGSERATKRAVLLGLFVLAVFRLSVLSVLPLDLSGDEAYYWEWGQHLDWGYYSKPPGIGWLMALAGWVGDHTTFGIRMFAVLLGTGSLAFVYGLGRCLYGVRTGALATLIFALTPANAALNLALTIDAPLLFCWTGALYSLWRFLETGCRSVGWGVALTALLIGGMLSKQMMIVFPVLAIVFSGLSQRHRPALRRAGLWLCLGGSLVAWLPPLYWNVQNDWVTFTHTLHQFESGSAGLGLRSRRCLEFLGGNLGLATPVVCVLLFGLMAVGLRVWRRLGERERYLWLFSGPGLLVMIVLSLRQRVNANWPAVFFPAGLLLLSGWIAGHFITGTGFDRWRRATAAALIVAGISFGSIYVGATALSLGWAPSPKIDPLRRLRGWSQLAADVDSTLRSLPVTDRTILIGQGHRYLASELAFYLPGHPRVYRFRRDPTVIDSQHDLWETPATRLGENALLIASGGRDALEPELRDRFDRVDFITELDYSRVAEPDRRFSLFHGLRLKRWPGNLMP
jgi:4-amino-4-deoxy-L-arabinose transferase-like glycosyltransferase